MCGDVLRGSQPAQRNLRLQVFHSLLVHRRQHVGLDEARRHRIDPHAERRDLLRQRLGEADDAGLRGRVIRLRGGTVDAGERRHVDDRAGPLLDELKHQRLRRIEQAAEIGRDHLIPLLAPHPRQRGVARNARIVDERVDPAELGRDRLDGVTHGIGVGDVARKRPAAPPRIDAFHLPRQLGRGVGVPVEDEGDVRALLHGDANHPGADAARAAGHQDPFVVEQSHCGPSGGSRAGSAVSRSAKVRGSWSAAPPCRAIADSVARPAAFESTACRTDRRRPGRSSPA